MRRRPFQKFEGEYLFETRRMAIVGVVSSLLGVVDELVGMRGTTAWVDVG